MAPLLPTALLLTVTALGHVPMPGAPAIDTGAGGQAWRACELVERTPEGFRALGSGFVVRFRGRSWLVSDAHVYARVADHAERAYVRPYGETIVFPFKPLRNDASCDLFVAAVATDLPSDDRIVDGPKVGDDVYTVGFPDSAHGALTGRVARGKVSKLIVGAYASDGRQPAAGASFKPGFLALGLDATEGASGSAVFLGDGSIAGYIHGRDASGQAVCFSGENLRAALVELANE